MCDGGREEGGALTVGRRAPRAITCRGALWRADRRGPRRRGSGASWQVLHCPFAHTCCWCPPTPPPHPPTRAKEPHATHP